jgi:hypothetical protein
VPIIVAAPRHPTCGEDIEFASPRSVDCKPWTFTVDRGAAGV